MSGPQWCTIESDPGVFTELISKFGVKGVQVEEFLDLDDATFQRLKPLYGLVFLFKYDKNQALKQHEDALDVLPDGLFFAKQVIQNACATQAILGILLNCRDRVELGSTLTDLYNFTKELDIVSRGMALENSEQIRTAHNSFAPSDPIEIEQIKDEDEEGEDAFHFISYVPYNGFIYEIDGLQKGPRLISECTDDDWFEKVKPTIQQRMGEYNGEVRFTLLGIIQDLKMRYENDLKKLEARLNNGNNGMNVDDEFDTLSTDETSAKIEELKNSISEETNKRQRWQKENVRRHHNYFPFIFAMLKVLSENNVLDDLTKRAEEKKKK